MAWASAEDMVVADGVRANVGAGVMISEMNTGLTGKMFGGNIAEVMGGAVAQDGDAILRSTPAREE